MSDNEDDKKTVVIDLNAIRGLKASQEKLLEEVILDLEFAVPEDVNAQAAAAPKFPVIFFDYQSDLFAKSLGRFPNGFKYYVVSSLEDLNTHLRSKSFQVVVFNYDANPKAVNQLCAQIKKKFPHTKTLIVARAISPSKAEAHKKTAGGANAYYQLPLDAEKFSKTLLEMYGIEQKISKAV